MGTYTWYRHYHIGGSGLVSICVLLCSDMPPRSREKVQPVVFLLLLTST